MINGMSEEVYEFVVERPKRQKRTVEYDEKDNLRLYARNKEEREKSFIHSNPKCHPLYKMEEKRGGELLNIRDALQLQCDETKALIKMLTKTHTFGEMFYCYDAFTSTPHSDNEYIVWVNMLHLLEDQYDKLLDWKYEVTKEIERRGGIEWERPDGSLLGPQ